MSTSLIATIKGSIVTTNVVTLAGRVRERRDIENGYGCLATIARAKDTVFR